MICAVPEAAKLLPEFVDREERRAADLQAMVVTPSADIVRVRIRNISSHGFSAEGHSTLHIGSQIVVYAPGLGRFDAQVRWALGRHFGAIFKRPACEVT